MKSTNINAFHQRHCERLQVMRQSMLFVTPLKPHRLTCVIASGVSRVAIHALISYH